MIILTELPNGNLEIKIDPEYEGARDEIAALIDTPLNEAFTEMMSAGGTSSYLGNGWDVVPPESIGALTDSPIIGYGSIYAEEGDQDLPIAYEKLWWFPQYQVIDPVEVLLRNGRVEFERSNEPAYTGAKILTWADFTPFSPCYDPAERYGEWSGTMLDLLDRKDIPVDDRVWALTTGVAWDMSPEKNLRLFACKCVREIWDLLTDERSRNAVEVAEKFAKGEAASEDLKAAQEAAEAAAVEAARAAEAAVEAARAAGEAAWAAARAAGEAAWEARATARAAGEAAEAAAWAARAACAAAEGAAGEAAEAAGEAAWATREAAWATREAAWAAAREVQIEIAKTLI